MGFKVSGQMPLITDGKGRSIYRLVFFSRHPLARYFRVRPVPGNAWLGVSVEDRRYGVPRIDHLRRVPASIRFLSVEPLLSDVGRLDLTDIHWVIVGGESGPKARPMKMAWAEAVRVQCQEQAVAFFFKQWGGWGADGKKRAKAANGRELNGRTWNEMPIRVAHPVHALSASPSPA